MTLNDLTPHLSRTEFEILRVIWKRKSCTVREVHDDVESSQGWAYTTTKTIMDRMVQKGLLTRESFHRIFLYSTAVSRPQGLVRWVRFFADRILEVDYASVVSLFGQSEALTPGEIEELAELLRADETENES